MIPLVSPKLPENRAKKKVRQSFESTNNSEIFNVSSGGNHILCLQKGILSPSCLPAFGKVYFRSLYRLIFHCERDFFFASESDSHFFDKTILPHFSPYVNHVKLFHLVVLDPRSIRDPGLPPGAFALPRCAPQGGRDEGLDNGLVGVLMDRLWRCVSSDF